MRKLSKLIWLLICLIGLSNNLSASINITTDSIKITQIVNEFYDWYLKAIEEKNYSEFKPKFVEAKNGMTTLDFYSYIENLKAKRFSDSLILKEKLSYSECIKNLEKVKYTDFKKTVFTDLDEYEQANCDFGNYYRWTGGQEPINGIRINDVKFISSDLVIVAINFFQNDKEKNKKYHWGENILTLIRIENDWFIDKIDSWKNDRLTKRLMINKLRHITTRSLSSLQDDEPVLNYI